MDAAYMLPSLRTRITADRHADPAAGVLAGNPVGQTEAADVAAPGTTAYLCGPPAMVDAARNRLIELGLPAAQIIAEQFVPTDQ
jgi:benzoate/toluate 1,2-dioxygenase reductase subunit